MKEQDPFEELRALKDKAPREFLALCSVIAEEMKRQLLLPSAHAHCEEAICFVNSMASLVKQGKFEEATELAERKGTECQERSMLLKQRIKTAEEKIRMINEEKRRIKSEISFFNTEPSGDYNLN